VTAQDPRWPNLFVVGAPRAGTTSLYQYLRQHPEIYMSPLKEPHFFSHSDPQGGKAVKHQEAYLQLFAGAEGEKLRGEASPAYLADPEAPARIKEVAPEAKIIAVLREPVARAFSAHWQRVRAGRESRSFLEAIEGEVADPEGWRPLVGPGFYADSLERYLGLFDGDVLVLFFDDFAADVRREMRKVYEFVGVDASFADRFQADVHNPFALPRNRLTTRIYRSRSLRGLARRARRVLPVAWQRRVGGVVLARTEAPEIEPRARELLQELYAREPDRLRELLGRPVPW
jgi:hypothetical protein